MRLQKIFGALLKEICMPLVSALPATVFNHTCFSDAVYAFRRNFQDFISEKVQL